MTTTTFDKSIRYDRATGDFAAYLDDNYIGHFTNHHDAEVALDQVAYDQLADGSDADAMAEEVAAAVLPETAMVSIVEPGLVDANIQVWPHSTVELVERQPTANIWYALLVDGRYHNLVMKKHTIGRDYLISALNRALGQVEAAIEALNPQPAERKERTVKTFTRHEFDMLGVCSDGLARVEAFGGAIENSLAGWQAYIDANPEAWRAPLFTAWRLHKRGNIACPDLIWKVARIAFREQPERNAALRVYGETLGPGNWREARTAAYAAAVAAYAAYAGAADADAAADAADDAAGAADAARKRVRAEIVAMAVEALDTLNH